MASRVQLVLLLVLSAVITSHATTYYWVSTSNTAWNAINPTGWSTSSGGIAGATALPGVNDDVIFDGVSGANGFCSININTTVKSLTINGYTGTVFQFLSPFFVTGQLNIASGTYRSNNNLGTLNQPLTVGSFSQTGGTFIATTGTMTINGNADFNSSGSGTFNVNNGTINFRTITDTGGNITITSSPSTVLNNMIISAQNAYTAVHTVTNNLVANNVTFDLINGPGKIHFFVGPSGSLTVNGALTFSAGAIEHYLSGGKIYVKGDINLNGTASVPTDLVNPGTIEINGSSVQTITSTVGKWQNRLPNIMVSKTAGSNLNLVGMITACGNWTLSSGTILPGTSTLFFYQTSGGLPITVSGTQTLADVEVELDYYVDGLTIINNLTVGNFTLNAASAGKINLSAGTLTINNVFDLIGGGIGIVLKGGIINAKGDINLSASYTLLDASNTSTIVINGVVDQTVTGNTTLGACILPNITIDKPNGIVTFKNTISLQGEWLYINGAVDAVTNGAMVYQNSIYVAGVNRRIDAQSSTTTMKFYHLSLQNNGNSVLLDGALAVVGNLTIAAIGPTQFTTLNTSGTTLDNAVNIGGDLLGAGTFSPNNSIVTLDGNVDQNFYQVLPITIKTLEVNKASGKVNLNADVIIPTTGQLKLTQGIISVPASGKLTLKNLATTVPALGNTTSYVDGALNVEVAMNATHTLYLPLGVASVNAWRPAEFTVQHSNATPYTYTAEIKNSPARMLPYSIPTVTLLYVSAVRYLEITGDIPSTSLTQASIKLYFGPDDQVTDLSYLNVAVARATTSTGTPTAWLDIAGAGTGGVTSPYLTGSISSTIFTPLAGTSFKGHFALATKTGTPFGVNPLPIELSSFTVDAQSNDALLKWITQVELNNDYFIIERAEGSQPFTGLNKIKGAGTVKGLSYYSWLDKNPPAGKLYYRLKQVDFDGKSTYSKVVSFLRNDAQEVPFTIYPIPVLNSTIYFSSISTVRIISATGQTLSNYENVEQVDVSNLTSGMYYIINKKGKVQKMIIAR